MHRILLSGVPCISFLLLTTAHANATCLNDCDVAPVLSVDSCQPPLLLLDPCEGLSEDCAASSSSYKYAWPAELPLVLRVECTETCCAPGPEGEDGSCSSQPTTVSSEAFSLFDSGEMLDVAFEDTEEGCDAQIIRTSTAVGMDISASVTVNRTVVTNVEFQVDYQGDLSEFDTDSNPGQDTGGTVQPDGSGEGEAAESGQGDEMSMSDEGEEASGCQLVSTAARRPGYCGLLALAMALVALQGRRHRRASALSHPMID